MTHSFETQGRALLTNGYLIIPIKPGEKRPAMAQWETARLGAGDLARYKACGVGVLTGQGAAPLAAIDIDTTNEALALAFTAWCEQHLGVTVACVGKASKILLVYRADEEDWSKATGAWFTDLDDSTHRLEVLGRGQQFVAYSTHPETGRPYEWVDLLGGLEAVPASELPIITEAQVHEALAAFEDLALQHGLERQGRVNAREVAERHAENVDPFDAQPVGVPLEELVALMRHLPNEDYDTWLKVGMALHHEYGGNADALDAWDQWSMGAGNYQSRKDIEARWESFGRRTGQPLTARWILKLGHQGEREAIRSEKRALIASVSGAIASCADSSSLLLEVARQAGEAAGTDLAARTELLALLRAKFKELSGVTLTVADARKAMLGDKKHRTIRARRERTEFGNAERMLDHYGDGLMYVPELDHWYTWTGVYWRRAAQVELEHYAKETIRALPAELDEMETDDERSAFLDFCAVSQRSYMVESIVRLAKSDPRVVVPVADLDKHHHLLGVGNGAVNLRTGRLEPPDPENRITLSTPIEYDAEARCPLWTETLMDVFFDDAEQVAFFQRLIGYTILGRPDEDLLIIPYGNGANGKSTVLGAIRIVLGGHARMSSAETFLTAQGAGGGAGGAREDVLRLRGARMVYVTEPDEGSELKEGMVKSMTGGEPMPARGLYAKHTIEVTPTWTTFMPTNHRPIIKGDDNAIWRRLLPVPFTRNFETDTLVEKDPDRAQRLLEEASGILRWCVLGAARYLEQGLNPPPKIKGARDAYRTDMDLLADWLAECCEEGPQHHASSADLWASWEAFARGRGEIGFLRSSRALGRRLANRFEPCKVGGHRGFKGLKVVAGEL